MWPENNKNKYLFLLSLSPWKDSLSENNWAPKWHILSRQMKRGPGEVEQQQSNPNFKPKRSKIYSSSSQGTPLPTLKNQKLKSRAYEGGSDGRQGEQFNIRTHRPLLTQWEYNKWQKHKKPQPSYLCSPHSYYSFRALSPKDHQTIILLTPVERFGGGSSSSLRQPSQFFFFFFGGGSSILLTFK